jgi:hypothetical protein
LLRRARLVRANLAGSRLSGANCYGANFRLANLRGATAAGADFREAAWFGSDRTGAAFADATVEPGPLGRAWRATVNFGDQSWRTLQEVGPILAGPAAARALGSHREESGPGSRPMPGPVPAAVRAAKKSLSAEPFHKRPMPLSGLAYLLSPPTAAWDLNLVGVGIG